MTTTWKVRAEAGGRLFGLFKERSLVCVGWPDVGPLDDLTAREESAARVAERLIRTGSRSR